MFLCIADVLSPDLVGTVRGGLEKLQLRDGRETAGDAAALVKHNLQINGTDPAAATLTPLVLQAISANPVFASTVRPKALGGLLFSRYDPGMSYGTHADEALMGGLRADVSFTLFLSDPASYDGGALVIENHSGRQEIKLPAGAMVTYPSSTLHHVASVTQGQRYAVVGWVRSLVRDPARREVLYDLDQAAKSSFAKYGKTSEVDLLHKSFANLARMWIED